jgi:rubrerythrin
MGNIFAGSEVLQLGIEIEKNGKAFYEAVAKKTKNSAAQQKLLFLATEEDRHIATFNGLLESVARYEPAESYLGEYVAYMHALASEQIFTQKNKGEEIAQKTKSDKEAIDLGIGFEKDSIIFYEGMKRVVPQDGHKIVDKIIAQEQNHLRLLSELKNNLSS